MNVSYDPNTDGIPWLDNNQGYLVNVTRPDPNNAGERIQLPIPCSSTTGGIPSDSDIAAAVALFNSQGSN